MTTDTHDTTTVEFPRPIEADALKHGVTEKRLEATAEERKALQKRFAIDALSHLSGTLTLSRKGSGERLQVAVNGKFKASLTQTCVVTLEPFDVEIEADIESLFKNSDGEQDENWDLTLEDEDPPETIVDGIIDLGELVAQSLSLEISLHPRKPGAESPLDTLKTANRIDGVDDSGRENPFAVLQKLKFDPKQ